MAKRSIGERLGKKATWKLRVLEDRAAQTVPSEWADRGWILNEEGPSDWAMIGWGLREGEEGINEDIRTEEKDGM